MDVDYPAVVIASRTSTATRRNEELAITLAARNV
jgi:hypothetical protein